LRIPEQLFRHCFRENVDELAHGVLPPTLFGYRRVALILTRGLAGYTRVLTGSAGAAANSESGRPTQHLSKPRAWSAASLDNSRSLFQDCDAVHTFS
jgi:hypothetical protein